MKKYRKPGPGEELGSFSVKPTAPFYLDSPSLEMVLREITATRARLPIASFADSALGSIPRGGSMSRATTSPGLDLSQSLLKAYAVNERMNQLILEQLDPRVWRAKLPGQNTRTIAAIFSHVHNIRRKWLRLSAPHLKLPAQLDRTHSTQRQAGLALAESAGSCIKMLADALASPPIRVKKFHRDGWAKPWPSGGAMFAYMLTHDAHHRGQICMLAHQLGFPLPPKVAYGMWGWEKLWKECGFQGPR